MEGSRRDRDVSDGDKKEGTRGEESRHAMKWHLTVIKAAWH